MACKLIFSFALKFELLDSIKALKAVFVFSSFLSIIFLKKLSRCLNKENLLRHDKVDMQNEAVFYTLIRSFFGMSFFKHVILHYNKGRLFVFISYYFNEINRIQELMNSFSITILILSLPTLSSGFYTFNCERYNNKTCEILFTPFDDLFKNVFLPTIDGLTQLAVTFGITGYETDPKTILGQVNEDLKEVNQSTIKKFVGNLTGVTYKNPTRIELIAGYSPFFLPEHIQKSIQTGLSSIRNILSGFNYIGR
uniref:WS_DGAT_C domain-containing protein n=1 Tax=Strongyloides venezuelensis TaxID=75913 RepID=A0A0K0FFJ3_STRVS